MSEMKKYGIQVEAFAKNILNEALANRDSFLFHEVEGYESGLIGYHKPLSTAMFSNYEMVETIKTILEPDISGMAKWDATQLEVYCRVVLMTFRDYVEKGYSSHSVALYCAKCYIEHSASDIYKLNEIANLSWDDHILARLMVVVKFIKNAVNILNKIRVPNHLRLRIRENNDLPQETFYDHLAVMVFEVIFSASAVTSPDNLCWDIQHNCVFSELFNFDSLNSTAGNIVKFKIRRLLYKEIIELNRFPNFKGARILRFCLNVMGFTVSKKDYDKDSRALQKVTLAWTRRNYVWLHGYNQRIAEACLVDGMTYDAENLRLVRTYPVKGLRRETKYDFFELDAAPPETDTPNDQPR